MLRLKRIILSFFLLLPFFSGSTLFAAEIILKNGDRVSGEILNEQTDAYVIETEAMGPVTIRKTFVESLVTDAEDQPLAPVPKEPEEEEKIFKHWDGEIGAGFDRRRGNTDTTEIRGDFLLHRKIDKEDRKNEFTLEADAYYSGEEREMNTRKYYGMTRYAFSFGPGLKLYNFYKLEADHDRFSNIDYRLIPATGIGYWLFDRERIKTLAEIAAGVEYTNYRQGGTETEGILIPRIYFEKILFAETKISEDLTLYPSITNPGEYRLKSETVLDNPINDHFTLRFTLLDEYNSNPGGDAEKNDIRITSSLVYSF